jgi:hypothetical protein
MPIGAIGESVGGGCGGVWDLVKASVILVVRLVRIDSVWGLSGCIKSVDSAMDSRWFEFFFFWSRGGLRGPKNLL